MENNKNYEQLNALLNGLNDEQKKKVNKCKDVNEFMLLLGELGIALPDELLDNVSGGTQDEMEFINQLCLWDEVCRQRGIGVYDAIRREQVWRELFPNG
jgi:hypothetical protein